MTTVRVERDGQRIRSLTVKGHAGFAESGHDIVCAAVSTLITTCANALETVAGVQPATEQSEAYLRVALPQALSAEQQHDAQIILKSILQGFRDLQEQYPKHLDINDGRKTPC